MTVREDRFTSWVDLVDFLPRDWVREASVAWDRDLPDVRIAELVLWTMFASPVEDWPELAPPETGPAPIDFQLWIVAEPVGNWGARCADWCHGHRRWERVGLRQPYDEYNCLHVDVPLEEP